MHVCMHDIHACVHVCGMGVDGWVRICGCVLACMCVCASKVRTVNMHMCFLCIAS